MARYFAHDTSLKQWSLSFILYVKCTGFILLISQMKLICYLSVHCTNLSKSVWQSAIVFIDEYNKKSSAYCLTFISVTLFGI